MKKIDLLAMYVAASTAVALAAIAHAQQLAAPANQDSVPQLVFPTQAVGELDVPGTEAAAASPFAAAQPPGVIDPAPIDDELPAPALMLQAQADQPDLAAETAPRGEMGVWLVASNGAGVIVRRVSEESAAARAGLQAGDVLLQVNGQGAMTPQRVSQTIRSLPPGEIVTLNVWREGTLQEFSVALQPLRASAQAMSREPYETSFRGESATSATGSTSADGNLESRTMRLEEQLTVVMKELQRMRQEMSQIRTVSGTETAGSGLSEPAAVAEPATDSGFSALEQPPLQPEAAEPALRATEPSADADIATEPAPVEFEAPATEEPAAEEPAVEATATEEPAMEEPAAEAPGDESDPFADDPASEPAAEEAPATDAEVEPAEEPASDAEEESLFE